MEMRCWSCVSIALMVVTSSPTHSLRSMKAHISILALEICLVFTVDRIGRGLFEGRTRTDLAHLLGPVSNDVVLIDIGLTIPDERAL